MELKNLALKMPQQSEEFLRLSDVIDIRWYHIVLLEIVMLSPTVIILLSNFYNLNILVTLLIQLGVVLIGLPWLAMKILNCPLIYFLYNELEHVTKQIHNGFIFFLSIFFSIILGYLFLSQNYQKLLKVQNDKSELFIMTSCMVYSLVNPIFEEWFWRIFVRKIWNRQEREYKNLYISLHYAAAYGVLIYSLSSSQIITYCLTLFFFLANEVFQIIGEKSGIISSMLAQMGMHIAVSIIMIDIINRKK
ncbi:CAAX protease self-immunity protein (macronuclear) [Tetrahymena thermophila SB210]|uniref:CAAX protease self-immunity protein n=1 Tax=Tetrahymena thermophila (strain SB210) TaxID=312017 RepID=I7M7X6_TETTS|nr:CAAX protease self-immunity protein [Tetrahymena thermophila SB210]EAR96195.1 CAAX protease self-immunity protein [Tetrahymena thermophila SB210]|eukprot:XP_001016440.1 CAAX protease self-immunity protein [Tetrahymena thermophila SB210]